MINESVSSFRKNYELAVPGIIAVFAAAFLNLAVMRARHDIPIVALAGFLGLLLNFFAYGVTLAMAREAVEAGSTSLGSGVSAAKGFLGAFLAASALLSVILTLGFALYIIPGVAAAFLLMFVFPAIVMEEEGAVGALGRSYAVVRDNLGDSAAVFAVVLAGGFVVMLVNAFLKAIPFAGPLLAVALSGAFMGMVSLLMIEAYRELSQKAGRERQPDSRSA